MGGGVYTGRFSMVQLSLLLSELGGSVGVGLPISLHWNSGLGRFELRSRLNILSVAALAL